jgi:acetylornithine/N-succinyldiaminopimelate aminotransferase
MSTLSEKLKSNEAINKAFEQISRELDSLQSEIQSVKAPTEEGTKRQEVILEEITDTRGRPLFYPYVGSGVGRGPYVELEDGSIKMDLINGIGVNILGHSHPRLAKAMMRAGMSDLVMQGNLQPNGEYTEMLKRLKKIYSKNFKFTSAWISTCGTMANENALKACRQKNSPADKIVAFGAAFAGRSTLMAEVTDNKAYKQGLPDYDDVLRIPFYNEEDPKSAENTLNELKKHIEANKGKIACFVFEPIQGEGGFNVAPKEFFVPLFELCKENNIAIWADEVQTFCRSGEFFACEKLGVAEYIDVMTIAKSLQAAATLFSEEYKPQPGLIAGTFAGSTCALAAGNAVLEELETGGYFGEGGKIEWIHNTFKKKLLEKAEGSLKGKLTDVSGMGLMMAITCFDGSKERMMEILKALYKNGIISFGCGRGPFKVRFLIPAIMQEKEIDEAVSIIEKTLLEFED